MCEFNIAWVGQCKGDGSPRCEKHAKEKCIVCGELATHQCDETAQFVCGFSLCNNCEHRISPEGDNGGIAYMSKAGHCRKTEQKHLPWYMRPDPEVPLPDDLKKYIEEWKAERNMA